MKQMLIRIGEEFPRTFYEELHISVAQSKDYKQFDVIYLSQMLFIFDCSYRFCLYFVDILVCAVFAELSEGSIHQSVASLRCCVSCIFEE